MMSGFHGSMDKEVTEAELVTSFANFGFLGESEIPLSVSRLTVTTSRALWVQCHAHISWGRNCKTELTLIGELTANQSRFC